MGLFGGKRSSTGSEGCDECGRVGKHKSTCRSGGQAGYERAKAQSAANANSTARAWIGRNKNRVDTTRYVPGHSRGIPAGVRVVRGTRRGTDGRNETVYTYELDD